MSERIDLDAFDSNAADEVPAHPTRSAAVRRLKQASATQLNRRRAALADAVRRRCEVPRWNAGESVTGTVPTCRGLGDSW